MGKRPAGLSIGDENTAPSKRQKVDPSVHQPAKVEEIYSGRQLQQLLRFQQNDAAHSKYAFQSFKAFFDSILHRREDPNNPKRRAILKDYLNSQSPRDEKEQDHVFMADVMQAWSFAAQSNNDSLLSAVPAVLALLLRSISTLIDLREHGIQLCKTILQTAQLKNISRGLGAPKTKEHVISPCLRLLTEVVSFDGGILAKKLFSRQDSTLNSRDLVRNLGLRRAFPDNSAVDKRKPSVRYNALRYLLANFKYQDHVAKGELLGQATIVKAIFDDIGQDSPEIIADILQVSEKHIILDRDLPRSSKSRFLTERTLDSIGKLYSYDEFFDDLSENQISVDVIAHNFLLMICTKPEAGALVSQSGWYPPGTENDHTGLHEEETQETMNLGLDSLDWFEKFHDRVPVRNTTLAAFAQNLRPYANTLQAELLLALFKSAPELVADYYFKKKNFSFDPKLTATWIGYSAFIFSTVQLEVPEFVGRKDSYGRAPPPESIVIESILPQHVNQSTLRKCLNQKTELIAFFAIRLMTVAFEKLKAVLASYKTATLQQGTLWEQASSRLISEFCRRCPNMKEVITTYRSTSNRKMLQREAITRLVRMYYEVVPQIALYEKFDVSIELASRLDQLDVTKAEAEVKVEDRVLLLLELEHLLIIAQRSPSMRWWHKPDTLKLSPFTTVLKLLVDTPETVSLEQVKALLQSIIVENSILQQSTHTPALDALVASLRTHGAKAVSHSIFAVLDDVILRLVRKPVKYIDDLEAVTVSSQARNAGNDGSISLLYMTLLEQWPFVVKTGTEIASEVASWLGKYLWYSTQIGEDAQMLLSIRDRFIDATGNTDYVSSFREAFERKDGLFFPSRSNEQTEKSHSASTHSTATTDTLDPDLEHDVNSIFADAAPENEDHPELHTWIRKEVQDVVEDDGAGGLIICLCSEYLEIRKQALSNLRKLQSKVKASTYSERQQIYLLLGELIETAEEHDSSQPLPYFVGVFAAQSVQILKDPLHPLYGKINRFLNKGPSWVVARLPSYWVDKILLKAPDYDDCHYKEVEWLLDTFTDGLRTARDMEVYRIRNVFERLLSLYSSPFLSVLYRKKIIVMLIRAASVDGSTTLITRSGVISWIDGQIKLRGPTDVILKRLRARLLDTCDKKRISEWSGELLGEQMAV